MLRTWARAGAIAAALTGALPGAGLAQDSGCDTNFAVPYANVQLEVLASINHPLTSGVCKKFSAVSAAYDPATRRLFVANPFDALFESYDLTDPRHPQQIATVRLGGPTCNPANPVQCSRPNHVAVADGIVAVTVVSNPGTDPGRLVLFDTNGTILRELTVGASPTWVAFTPDRTKIVVVNQGVPSSDYTIDPESSITIVEDWATAAPQVTPVSLEGFNSRKHDLIASGVRIYGPCVSSQPCEVTVAQDLEPVSLAIAPNSARAWVTFETNNALGFVDLERRAMSDIRSLGLKDHSRWRNALDATVDNDFDLRTWPIYGMYQANGVDAFRTFGRTFVITANRGNWREQTAFPESSERTTVEEACAAGQLNQTLCYETVFNGFQGLAAGIPDLSIARYPFSYNPDPAAPLPGAFAFGGRSFSIWTEDGRLVHDSGAALEAITHHACPAYFNSQSDQNTFDDRSDDKGPEPEGVVTAAIGGHTFAFVTSRRIGGILSFDVTVPWLPLPQQYINNRDFSIDPKALPPGVSSEYFVNCAAGDLQAMKPVFVPAAEAPGGEPLLIVINNYSGTVTLYAIHTALQP